MVELFANSGDPDQMPLSAVPDLGLHCLPVTLLRVSRLQWVKVLSKILIEYILFYVFFRQTKKTWHFLIMSDLIFSKKKSHKKKTKKLKILYV